MAVSGSGGVSRESISSTRIRGIDPQGLQARVNTEVFNLSVWHSSIPITLKRKRTGFVELLRMPSYHKDRYSRLLQADYTAGDYARPPIELLSYRVGADALGSKGLPLSLTASSILQQNPSSASPTSQPSPAPVLASRPPPDIPSPRGSVPTYSPTLSKASQSISITVDSTADGTAAATCAPKSCTLRTAWSVCSNYGRCMITLPAHSNIALSSALSLTVTTAR